MDKTRFITPLGFSEDIPTRFFYCATKEGLCGAAMILNIKKDHHIQLRLVVGNGTHTRALACWGVPWFSKKRGILCINCFGDSKVVIDWENGLHVIQVLELEHWIILIYEIMKDFAKISFQHVYRELNILVDTLSKRALGHMTGILYFEEYSVDGIIDVGPYSTF